MSSSYRTRQVAPSKSFDSKAGQETYADLWDVIIQPLQTSTEGKARDIPEEPTHLALAQAGDVDVPRHLRLEIDRSHIVPKR